MYFMKTYSQVKCILNEEMKFLQKCDAFQTKERLSPTMNAWKRDSAEGLTASRVARLNAKKNPNQESIQALTTSPQTPGENIPASFPCGMSGLLVQQDVEEREGEAELSNVN